MVGMLNEISNANKQVVNGVTRMAFDSFPSQLDLLVGLMGLTENLDGDR
jgi:hypothetical protein